MKKSIICLTLILLANLSNAQEANYETQWKKIDTHEKEGLPKSALKVVDDIYRLAKKDKNQRR